MSWRREFKAVAAALGVLAMISVAGASLDATGAGKTVQIVDAAGTGITYEVGAAAQHGTLAYWTTERMWAAATAAAATPQASVAPKGTPSAAKFSGSPTSGALFYTTGGKAHFCSASVVNSTTGDLVLTAAHCVYGTALAANVVYVPQYHDGKRPYGTWPVHAITVASGWERSHDPDLDFAFLTVGPVNGSSIQARTGGLTMGFGLSADERIEVIGHNDTDDEPIRCATKSFLFRAGQMEFYCHGFWTGTSGGPWILGYNAKTGKGTVFGVIGGYEGGGDYEWTSYSPYFGSAARSLYQQAERRPAAQPALSPTSTPTSSPSPTSSLSPTSTPSPSGSATSS